MKSNLLMLIAGLFIFTACETQHRYRSEGWAQKAPSYGYMGGQANAYRGNNTQADGIQPFYKLEKAAEQVTQPDAEEERMMIYNASITLLPKNKDTASARISEIAKKYHGYILSSGSTEISIRVESTHLKEAMAAITTLGKTKEQEISGNDVTNEFTDYQIRLENAEKSRKRYLELLARANTVEEALKVEKELERLNGDIDMLKGRINRIGHLVNYSTIRVYYHDKVKPGILGYVFIGAYKAVKWLFVRN